MERASWRLDLQRGEPFRHTWQMEVSEDGVAWTPMPTGGYSVLHQVRRGKDEGSELLLDIGGEGWVSINASGLITWNVPKQAVLGVPDGVWHHDVAITDPDGNPTYVATGQVLCQARVSVQGGE